jgi:hypothetical protein
MENSTTDHNNKEFTPEEQLTKAVADYQTTEEWRSSSSIQERRFVLRTPSADVAHNLTANTLAGGDKISVPPFVFVDGTQASVHAFYYLGSGLWVIVGCYMEESSAYCWTNVWDLQAL